MEQRSAMVSRTKQALWPGAMGDVEVMVTEPLGPPKGLALLCHPHPLHGGQMHNKVVTTLARAFDEANYRTLRFNFRGVGKSAGVYDGGKGEQDDCIAMIKALRAGYEHLPWSLAGFSFGAYVAARVALQHVPAQLLLVAPPVTRLGLEMPTAFACDVVVLQGQADEVVPAQAVSQWADSVTSPCQLLTFEACSHFFHGQLVALRDAIYHAVVSHDT
jgi:uncharacterized protein